MTAKKDTSTHDTNGAEATGGTGAATAVAAEPKGAASPKGARATPGRVLHVYGPDQYERVRPGTVVLERDGNRADVNVEFHGELDAKLQGGGVRGLAGQTLMFVPVFEAMTEAQRNERIRQIAEGADIAAYWAEFPPRV